MKRKWKIESKNKEDKSGPSHRAKRALKAGKRSKRIYTGKNKN